MMDFKCPVCDRRFIDETARRRHILDSKNCNAIEEIGRLRFLLADRDEALAVARRQRDEAREWLKILLPPSLHLPRRWPEKLEY